MEIFQKTFCTSPRCRGFHLIGKELTQALTKEITVISAGSLHLFLKYTAASLALGENYKREVREDVKSFFRASQ